MFSKLTAIFDSNSKQVKLTDKKVEEIKALREQMRNKSFDEMKKRINEMKSELKELVNQVPEETKSSLVKVDRTKALPKVEIDIQNKLQEFMPEVYAFVDEIFRRKTGYNYHDVQLKAAVILSQGQRLTELYTGEGKTRTFQLPLILYSLVGRGAHLVTVNDYLSRRDGEYAGHIASELGLSVGIINSSATYKFVPDEDLKTIKGEEFVAERDKISVDESKMGGINLIDTNKREAYACDITYGTNNEFGFDYLRDNMAWDLSQLSQRELYFCIIDEADSILIDEARTPLIISGVPSEADTKKYAKFAQAVKDLEENSDYLVDHKTRSVTLTENGIVRVESNLGVENLWSDYTLAYHIENALKAKAMFNKDEHYLVKGGEVLIVDEFTGRILKGRRYSEGLHQAIEAKEGVNIQQESKTFATITFQNFFRLYKILCGGSGTVMTEAEEFYKIYGLETIQIPTNKPVIRKDYPDLIFKSQEGKFKAVIAEIKEANKKGQPVLVGTTSVEKSELISNLLDKEGISHEVLNAKYHEQEAKIIERAGRKGAVTVATNMAGRGADIVIGGGRRGDDAWKEIAELGGLYVIGTERHEARRIDNQLRGRTGRQGEPGASRFFVSLDDQLMRILGGEVMSRIMNMVGLQDDMPIELKLISRQIETAQKRIESMNFDARKRIVEYDDVMNQHREIFYSRRRNFLEVFEGTSGKFLEGSRFIEINNLGDQSLSEDLKVKKEEFRDRSVKLIKNLFSETLVSKIETVVNSSKKVSNDDVKNLLVKYIPQNIISNELNENFESMRSQELIDRVEEIINIAFERKLSEFGDDFYSLGKIISLQSIDNMWVDHLELMKDIKEGIGLRAYAQKDPLVEYKNEAFVIFSSFIKKINDDIAAKILNLQKVQARIERKAELQTNTDEIDDVNTGDREFIQGTEVKSVDSVMSDFMKKRIREQGSMQTNSSESNSSKLNTSKQKEIGRNDKVSVKYSDGRVVENVKYKKVENDIKSGLASLVS